jgi:hypothetical protein
MTFFTARGRGPHPLIWGKIAWFFLPRGMKKMKKKNYAN